jgi:hypothetical protein
MGNIPAMIPDAAAMARRFDGVSATTTSTISISESRNFS